MRSINVEKNELLLVTPVPLSLIQDVDTLVLGPLSMPPSFLGNRSSLASRRPYVQVFDKSAIFGTNTMQSRRDLKRRKFQT